MRGRYSAALATKVCVVDTMNTRSSSTICTLLLLGAACQTPPQDAAGTGTELPLSRFRQDSFAYTQTSGYLIPTQLVIRDQAAWAEAWRTLHAGHQSEPPLPLVEFDREIVVLAALGSRNTGGYDVLLEAASIEGSQVTLTVRETAPGSTCARIHVLTQPVDIARLSRREEPIHFVTVPCEGCGITSACTSRGAAIGYRETATACPARARTGDLAAAPQVMRGR